jgi:hypothetical protein
VLSRRHDHDQTDFEEMPIRKMSKQIKNFQSSTVQELINIDDEKVENLRRKSVQVVSDDWPDCAHRGMRELAEIRTKVN